MWPRQQRRGIKEETIEVSIIDESTRRDCDAACGTDWASPEAVALAIRRIKDRFGDGVRLEYSDLSHGSVDQRIGEWRQAIRERNLSVPLLLVNGRLRIAGQFDVRQIVDAIEAEMEIGI